MGRAPPRGQPASLGNPFLAFFFGFFHFLGQKFSTYCGLLLIFVCMLSVQSNKLMFVLQDTGSDRTPEAMGFGPGFLCLGAIHDLLRTSSSLERLKSSQILLFWAPGEEA